VCSSDLAGKESTSLLVPVLISGIVGAGLALLLTPKSGRDLRQDLKRYASSAGEQAPETVETAAEGAKGAYQESTTAIAQPLDGAGHPMGPPISLSRVADGWSLSFGRPVTTWYAVTIVR